MSVIRGLLVAAAAAATLGCQAAAVTIDFVVSGGSTGPLAGQSAAGHFTFDDSVAPAGGGTVNGTALLIDLALTWNGIAYDETTANTGELTFDAAGQLIDGAFGSDCAAGSCYLSAYAEDWVVSLANPSYFAYSLGGGQAQTVPYYSGSVTATRRATPVPEPAAPPLIALALAALATVRKRSR